MVIYFESHAVSPPYTIYMGVDKHENEELIRWGWPEDVWFHVDKMSSAHVYLRLHPGEMLESVPEVVLQDCAQLVKANSIQGCKVNDVDVVYTMWANLKKTGDMDVGQVGFHRQKEVHKIHVEKRIGDVVKRLEKTRQERQVDLRTERDARDQKERIKVKEVERERRKAEREEAERKEKDAEAKSYDRLFTSEKMRCNTEGGYDSDEFM